MDSGPGPDHGGQGQLDPQQLEFRDLVRDFTDREVRPVARELEQSGTYPSEIVAKMADMGLFGLNVPVEWGGLGVDTVTLALVFEELSRGWMGIAGMIGSHGMACKLIAAHGTEAQKQQHLADLAAGRRRSGLALTEPDAGSDLQGIRTRAERDGDEYIVTGTKTWITNARHSDPLPVLVKTDPDTQPAHRGMSILLVAADTPGMTITRDLGKLGYKGPETCEVVFDEARVPTGDLLGGNEGRGMAQAISGLQTGRVNIAARAVGVAHRDARQRPGRRDRVRHGEAVRLGGSVGGLPREHAGSWRLRILDGVRGRAPLPGRPVDGHRRGHQRHTAHRDRQGPS